MKVQLSKSPNKLKKFRVTFENNNDHVDFGGKGYSDYTIHKTPTRMRLYIRRHGGVIDEKILDLEDDKQIHKNMLSVDKSITEDWSADGFSTAGFWSRWLLWSHPNLSESIEYIKRRFGIRVQYKK